LLVRRTGIKEENAKIRKYQITFLVIQTFLGSFPAVTVRQAIVDC
jgi:hypothetical protein